MWKAESPDGSPHYIIALDGGSDHLLPGRWLANVSTVRISEAQGHGLTRDDAIADLKSKLRWKYPNIPWYQSLPVVDAVPV